VNEGLGHTSHVVGLGDGTALVIDPARLPDRQRQLVAERGWRLAWSADTHSHADYISGSPELAADGAVFLAPARARLEHPHRGLEAGEHVELADGLTLRAIPTPGHTPEHLAYLLLEDDTPTALFSGGSLMVGTVGRTDLLGDEHREELAAQLSRALRDEILILPDDLAVYPTHGAGSFCSAPSSSERTTTIGRERATNPLLQVTDEHEFVERLLAGLGSFPTYFRMLPERNRRGVPTYREVPELPRLAAEEVARHVEQGAVLVDARPVAEFAAGHRVRPLSREPTRRVAVERLGTRARWSRRTRTRATSRSIEDLVEVVGDVGVVGRLRPPVVPKRRGQVAMAEAVLRGEQLPFGNEDYGDGVAEPMQGSVGHAREVAEPLETSGKSARLHEGHPRRCRRE
jgi:glyoxylase-like metal-dependent hydrolase (beta-lactamase superfamily II)